MTDLQHHVEFFDRNKDGIITMAESIEAFIRIGFDPATATTGATATHTAFGPLTTPPGQPWSTDIHVSHIHKAIHPSDSGVYDKKGNFVPKKFEDIFKFSRLKKDALTWFEVEAMLTKNRDIFRPLSWAAAETEWKLIYHVGRDGLGFLHRETIRGIYDGSIFPILAKRKGEALHSEE
ncbi:hypothetical protein QOZ80_6BG0467560 [Eleusine coracana subsp. coracana]|nr:hypothetical protein QOZ80_6BG0467560 [Eleusine coracana subsp. coracana]